ncbi:MAG: SpoIIE family protein phosphatase [Acidimicrobiia bacterium]|nr:SpoIIE family protein phosphatase [Acidimicrobiia bacterium]
MNVSPGLPKSIERLVQAAVVPMAAVSAPDGIVLQASPAFEALVRAPVTGVSLRESYPNAADLLDMLDSASRGMGAVRVLGLDVFGVAVGASATAQSLQWEWAATPLLDPEGAVEVILMTASDGAGQVEAAERIEMLEGLVFLSRRVSAAEASDDLYGVLATDIGLLLGASGCLILRLDQTPDRDPSARIVRPMLPGYGLDDETFAAEPLRIEPGTPAWRVIFQGETFASDDLEGDPDLAFYRSFFRGLGAKNGAAVPMRVRGTTLAVLIVFNKAGGFSAHDLDLAEVFAAEAALAIENARLFEEEHRIATTLQEALLPGPVPHVPGLDLAAIYRPAGPAGSVGGDFYDLFLMHDGRYALLLGDVSGKGPEAAAQTALVRHMARGLVHKDTHPGPIVAELNTAVCEQTGPEGFITLLFGVYDPATSLLRWANAGHPLPLVWRRGQAGRTFGTPGRALGFFPQADLHVDRLRLAPGDVIVWYTDGLVEARRPGGDLLGVAPLLRTLEGIAEHSAADIAEALYRRAVAHSGRLEDDVAILVAKKVAEP